MTSTIEIPVLIVEDLLKTKEQVSLKEQGPGVLRAVA
jgi:hypothetical protein